MIVNFYKVTSGDLRNKTLLTSKNIEHVPMRGEYVIYSNQQFRVAKVLFNIDTCEYDLYMARV